LNELAQAGVDTGKYRKPVTLDQQSVGRLSRMDALQSQAMARAMQNRRTVRERAVKAALDRLEVDDAFGWCDNCGEFIGEKRLDLDPALVRCVRCAR
jgi:DnaK suppressor protein